MPFAGFASITSAKSPLVIPTGGFTISPAFSGNTSWDLNDLGALNVGTYGEWVIVPTNTFTANLKCWGAGGAVGFAYTSNANAAISGNDNGPAGGGGGYSTAVILFEEGVQYILQIGQGGSRYQGTGTGATYLAGGVSNITRGGTQGGGYTGLFRQSVSQANALLIAGGGGGGGSSNVTTYYGGSGGGSSGLNGANGVTSLHSGKGGTQSAGGLKSQYNGATDGSALLGGLGAVNSAGAGVGGGGGGYFGGGGANIAGGGGGSGFIRSHPNVLSGSISTGDAGGVPANAADADRGGAGFGNAASSSGGTRKGTDGRLIIRLA